ncbi:hypothetical protein PCANC_20068 [Puccinia coronata f. sp. avenae]|uniref:Uncharacterized protein n=1 Tax=Puccinia coronata f. sp. avenae TaxID=200324 RepID=A0A2N5U8U7_9BASI|nr:hypothetical protein PCANC_24557 [Puccinia coronata f. sp. avenae]PLW34154.1 hypothetical protein PCANC_20068 [Puccinia coronata f. sp. avenae]PLW40053.1 hypothetical protein PCASD_11773 [Puccinia coronata f. sp. avenae]
MSRTSMRAQAATRSAALRREDLQREAAVRDLMEISQGHGSSQGIAHGSLPADDSREIADKAITRLRVKSNNKDVGLAHAIDTILTHPVAQGLIIIGFLLSRHPIIPKFHHRSNMITIAVIYEYRLQRAKLKSRPARPGRNGCTYLEKTVPSPARYPALPRTG